MIIKLKQWLLNGIQYWLKGAAQPMDANQQNQPLSRDEIQFFPPALAILHTPPHPISRFLPMALMIFILILILWACFGEVDIVSSGIGKIIPSSQVKIIQPFEKGIVTHIYVKDGDVVQKGAPLIELDRQLSAIEATRALEELQSNKLQLAAWKSFRATLMTPAHLLTEQAIVQIWQKQLILVTEPTRPLPQDKIDLYYSLLQKYWLQYQDQLATLESTLMLKQSDKEVSAQLILKLEKTLPLIAQQEQASKSLTTNKYVAQNDYLNVKRQLVEQTQDLSTEKARQQSYQASIDEVSHQIQSLRSQKQTEAITKITELSLSLETLEHAYEKAKRMDDWAILRAPVDGVIKLVSVTTIGEVVTEAQKLMQIVPKADALEAEITFLDKDIGFIGKGLPAEVKVDAYSFTKYGFVDGVVTHISDDAIVDEKLGLVYIARIKLNHAYLSAHGKKIDLIAGMSVTAEVKTGKRRVIEYFLSPISKYQAESIRER